MSGAYNYMFDSLSRIGNDACGITARDLQNSKTETYLTTNYVSKKDLLQNLLPLLEA